LLYVFLFFAPSVLGLRHLPSFNELIKQKLYDYILIVLEEYHEVNTFCVHLL
jgi:hypothetical protein